MVGQEFTTTDVLRLEVEADPSGLENLIANPSGELGGWGWVTPVAGSSMTGGTDLTYTSPSPAVASRFYSESAPIAAGQWVAASWVATTVTGYYRARFEWLDGAGAVLSSTTQTGYLAAAGTTQNTIAYQAPASTQAVRIRFDHYSTTGGANPTAGAQIHLSRVTMAKAATAGALVTARTNLIPNPSVEVDTAGWVNPGTRVNTQQYVGSWSMQFAPGATPPRTLSGTSGIPVTPGANYAVSAYLKLSTAQSVLAYLNVFWFTSAGAAVSNTATSNTFVLTSWTRVSGVVTAPADAAYAQVVVVLPGIATGGSTYVDAVMMERASTVGDYFDGATPDAGGWDYSWSGTAHNSESTAVLSSLAYIPPTEWLSILGPTLEVRISREELNLGTIEGTILDVALDPAQAGTLRPGRQMRASALADGTWTAFFTGTLRRAQVTYNPLDTTNKRARITFLAVDNTAALANHSRPDGVETIDELPYVLEGCGVPWNVNGSGDQVPTATVVAVNENATAADQVAITRDSNLGRAWVDRDNIVQVWDAAQLATTVMATLDETTYSDLSVDYDTERCINYVTVKVVAITASGETEETTYGPYTDSASIDTWGVRAQEFVIQWTDADETTVAAFAASILTANATPVVRINSVTIPIRTTEDLTDVAGDRRALLDLYDLVTASNVNTGVTSDSRITKLSHSITPTLWTLTLDFSTEGNVAAPQELPPLPSNRVSDWWPEVLMLYGSPATCPAGYLVMNGGTFSTTDYPELAAYLVSLGMTSGVLPNMTDVFPIGAGTKALGTTGGAPTKTIGVTNLPAHTHDFARRTGATAFGASALASASATGTLGTGTTDPTGGGTPLDVMPPWRALYFIIRAR